MKLYTAHRAPNPRRVTMFLAEKGVREIPMVEVDLNALEHKREPYRQLSPLAKVPALELDDGRVLTESRAICTWIEGRWPEPNLMGRDAEERAFIEMADRQPDLALLLPIAQVVATPTRARRCWSGRRSPTMGRPSAPRCTGRRRGSTRPCTSGPGWRLSASRWPTSPRSARWRSPGS